MSNLNYIKAKFSEYSLLQHPFYQAWQEGELTIDELKYYAKQYYHNEKALPTYISAVHSICEDINTKKILLSNLCDEEQGDKNHTELWIDFAESLGVTRTSLLKDNPQNQHTIALIEGYRKICRENFAKGIGALCYYEKQVTEVTQSKITGLKTYYKITSEKALKFFMVHTEVDEWHAQEFEGIISSMNIKEQEQAAEGVTEGGKLVWGFLDGCRI
jgi:pyrroloquinoline-quinone synthase